ncbi:MAG: PA2779 family protein [Kiloniellales bacterium]
MAVPMAVVMFLASGPLPAAQAAMVSTDQVLEQETVAQERGRILDFLARDEVRNQIQSMGVSPNEAAARVQALSDAEVMEIAAHFDEQPAGQSVVGVLVGAALLIFVILLITDLLCWTSVFNFTRCVD